MADGNADSSADAAGDRTAAADDRTAEDQADAGHAVTLRWLDGREETVRVEPGESVLDAAERAGVALPFGCRTGACATCTARLCDGARAVEASDDEATASHDTTRPVEHARPARALKQRHLDDGYVLPCVARSRDGCTLAVGSDVHAELVENPWK